MASHKAKQDPESLELKRIRDAMAVVLPGKIGASGDSEIDERMRKASESYLNVFYSMMGDLQTRHEAAKRASLKRYLKDPRFKPDRNYLIGVFDKVFNDAKKG